MNFRSLFIFFICTFKALFGLKCHKDRRMETYPKQKISIFRDWDSSEWGPSEFLSSESNESQEEKCTYCMRKNADFQNDKGVKFKMVEQDCKWKNKYEVEIKPMCLDLFEFSDKTIAVRSTR